MSKWEQRIAYLYSSRSAINKLLIVLVKEAGVIILFAHRIFISLYLQFVCFRVVLTLETLWYSWIHGVRHTDHLLPLSAR